MIAALRGKLARKEIDRVVVDVGGVGYLVHVSLQSMAELPAAGAEVSLFCHTHVREDALALYGFIDESERQAFELLKGVSGVGPKLAMTVLSGLPVRDLAAAITGAEIKRLTSIPGIGKKSAERLVVELRDRFAAVAVAAGVGERDAPRGDAPPEELVAALVNLGYKRPLAERAMKQVIDEQSASGSAAPPPEQQLRRALAVIQEL
ncbi:MAG: Holliday junction branch migration protein RuvA [Myxococcales bacterium]|nr:Holliday junction branch migration protein RuvA [Myxococcales bacterium]